MDAYVLDVLMPDLIGHDRRPAAFIVYLFLLRQTSFSGKDAVSVSLQTIATKTGLSKSAVQASIRHLRRRGLLDPAVVATWSVRYGGFFVRGCDPNRRVTLRTRLKRT